MKSRRKSGRGKRILTNLILICCAAVFLVSTWKLVGYLTEYKEGEQVYIKIAEHVTVPEVHKNKKGEKVVEAPVVDWEGLEQINSDIVAWIYIDGTSIQYPVTKGTDNEYYLHYTFEKEKNNCGSIFMDVNNQKDFTSDNTILYGHNMKTGKMFGSLKFYKDPDYYKDHPEIFLVTKDRILKYHIFSVYETEDTSDCYTMEFATEEDRQNYVDTCITNSLYDTGIEVGEEERLLTLSTCTSQTEEGRFVVQAKLVSDEEIKNEQ